MMFNFEHRTMAARRIIAGEQTAHFALSDSLWLVKDAIPISSACSTAKLAIHFPGLDGLDKPIVWVFPEACCLLALRLHGIRRA